MSDFEKFRRWIAHNPRRRAWAVRIAGFLNDLGIRLQHHSRRIVQTINLEFTDIQSDRFVHGQRQLHSEINAILSRQKREYPHLSYFCGYPYQSLGILNVFGERASEERFDAYGLRDLIGKDDVVLDIGCNCGFVGIVAAYRTGCRVTGIDINPHMIEIGRRCASYLHLDRSVDLRAVRLQDFVPDEPYSAVFSFATHWTDDGNYRVAIEEHLGRIHGMMRPGGVLVFETHCADVGVPGFYAALERVRHLFSWSGDPARTDKGTRELYIMRRI